MRKDPSLFSTDTVQVVDTLVISTEKVDTAFVQQTDTLIRFIQKDSEGQEIRIEYKWNTKTDTVEIAVDCPDNEVVIKTNTVTNTVKVLPSFMEKAKAGVIVIISLIVLYLIGRILYKYLHPP
jgi:hypothetical protein